MSRELYRHRLDLGQVWPGFGPNLRRLGPSVDPNFDDVGRIGLELVKCVRLPPNLPLSTMAQLGPDSAKFEGFRAMIARFKSSVVRTSWLAKSPKLVSEAVDVSAVDLVQLQISPRHEFGRTPAIFGRFRGGLVGIWSKSVSTRSASGQIWHGLGKFGVAFDTNRVRPKSDETRPELGRNWHSPGQFPLGVDTIWSDFPPMIPNSGEFGPVWVALDMTSAKFERVGQRNEMHLRNGH